MAYQYAAMAGMKIADGYFAAQNAKATAELNQDIYEMNAEFAELDAYDAIVEGETAEARYQAVIDNTLAEQSTIMKAKDIDTSYGSASTIEAETKFVGQLNMMEIQKQAQERALGYQREARDLTLKGDQVEAEGGRRAGQAMRSGIQSGIQSGLSGYAQYRKQNPDF